MNELHECKGCLAVYEVAYLDKHEMCDLCRRAIEEMNEGADTWAYATGMEEV